MDFILQKMSSHCKNALKSAYSLALSAGSRAVTPDHILYGLCLEKGSIAHQILSRNNIESFDIKKAILQKTSPKTTITQLGFSADAKKIIERAFALANRNRHSYIGTEHLLAASLSIGESLIKELAEQKNISLSELQRQLDSILSSTTKFPDFNQSDNHLLNDPDADIDPMISLTEGQSTNVYPALETFAVHLTGKEAQKNIDPVIGRETEINRLIQILSRRNKNNPLLLGEAGVGKTAIVEGLAKKIMLGEVPEILTNKKIYALDLGLILAGTSFRGEFENRLKQILQEAKKTQDIILFIDEIHTIIGAGAATGSLDAANLLKPILARGEIRCIGATTPQDYKKNIEPDPALERRFQPISVSQPNAAKAIMILNGLKPYYESYHRVKITPQAIQAAVELAEKYITDKFLPDKAIDLIDEASAALKINQKSQPEEKQKQQLKKRLERILAKKQEAVAQEKFSIALKYRAQEQSLLNQLKNSRPEKPNTKKDFPAITKKEIAAVVSAATGIPLHDLLLEEKQRLLQLEKLLSKKIIDQPEAVSGVAEFIRRSKAGVSNSKRPIGSFIFLGPSGVGKTELAKVLAEIVFGDPKALVKIDMSEFSESFNISKLIGAPAGYVGYREGATLTDAVKRRPYSVVLFDEIEKAHSSVFNLLLHVLEDGIISDGSGKEINFRNTIIIMTSNIGAEQFNKNSAIGFQDDYDPEKIKEIFEETKREVLKKLNDKFPPEFLNRIDKTIVFKPLGQSTLAKIAKLQLTDLKYRLAQQGTELKIHPEVIQLIALKSFAPNVGARTVRKNIQEIIEGRIAQKILSQPGSSIIKKIIVKSKDNAIII